VKSAGEIKALLTISMCVCFGLVQVPLWAEIAGVHIINADNEPGSWLTHARTYAEERYSPLNEIDADNVSRLGLAWYFDTNSSRGLEASPLLIDGVIYTTLAWSHVHALDARTGSHIWHFDPKVPKAWGSKACCDVVNRGVAAWGERLFVGTIDGRLIALDRNSGAVIWEKLTIDPELPYTITGAPRVIKGKVLIGNGGAEYGVRGYLSAYSVDDGTLLWRFYTVPGDPSKPFESKAMQMAAATWHGQWWEVGGGGTVWDSMAYDPDLDLLYFGVGNGSPWNRHIRSPGGGDNLFLSSVVAVTPDNGEYVWHYQTTPGDSWDYTATQHIILADLPIDGTVRKVLMQAPKNGFFYVLDRSTGELLSAEKYTRVNWASHVDLQSGRPVETEQADHSETGKLTQPMPLGGHNWQPMAFNRDTGLVYIPAMESTASYSTDRSFTYLKGHWNTGQSSGDAESTGALSPALMAALTQTLLRGRLIAWDPVQQREAWRVEHSGMWNGGVLTTAGNLVFQGSGDGRLVAYRADSGELLWQTVTRTGVIAPPISYRLDGEQYVAVMAGWGGAAPLVISQASSVNGKNGRLLVYKLGGRKRLPENPTEALKPMPPKEPGSPESVARGGALYGLYCARCHGARAVSGGLLADLRYMQPGVRQLFKEIVLGGIFNDKGMISFADVLNEGDVAAIQDYLNERSRALLEYESSPEWWQAVQTWFFKQALRVAGLFL
jgi:PQQ-dependent dehydrogenase (methanol/ethanol family)|tara:strand:- start:15722 stop:17887 length:2166 start_codon:yes stop_codon:yes gene_type:complete